MNDQNLIRQGLSVQHFPVYEADIPHIGNILYTINQAKRPQYAFANLNEKVPITVVDKGVIR